MAPSTLEKAQADFFRLNLRSYLTECIYQLVLGSQHPHEIVNFIVYYYLSEKSVDGFVGELTFYDLLIKTLCQISSHQT